MAAKKAHKSQAPNAPKNMGGSIAPTPPPPAAPFLDTQHMDVTTISAVWRSSWGTVPVQVTPLLTGCGVARGGTRPDAGGPWPPEACWRFMGHGVTCYSSTLSTPSTLSMAAQMPTVSGEGGSCTDACTSTAGVAVSVESTGRGGLGWVGGFGTRPWWLAPLACGGAYWPLALEPSAMTSRHPHYCGHPHCRGHPPAWVGESRMQLLLMASSPDGLISARSAVIMKTPGWEPALGRGVWHKALVGGWVGGYEGKKKFMSCACVVQSYQMPLVE